MTTTDKAVTWIAIICLAIGLAGAWQDRERIINAYCEVERICLGE